MEIDDSPLSSIAKELASLQQRYDALLSVLEADGRHPAPMSAASGDTPLAEALERRRKEYPATSLAGVAGLDAFGRALLHLVGPSARLRDVTTAHLETLLAPLENPSTFNNVYGKARTFFAWCVREGLLAASPIGRIRPKHVPYREPCHYSSAQVERILRLATKEGTDPGIGIHLVLGFFCGMRSSEILRAVAGDIRLEDGTVRVPIPKGYYHGTPPRLVQAPRNAVLWLRYFLRDSGYAPGDLVAAPRRELADWKRRVLAPEGLDWNRELHRNVMRHTACTMHVAAFRNLAETQLFLGHTRGSDITVRHYLGLESKREGERYWRIYPPPGGLARAARGLGRIPRDDPRFAYLEIGADGRPVYRDSEPLRVGEDGEVAFG